MIIPDTFILNREKLFKLKLLYDACRHESNLILSGLSIQLVSYAVYAGRIKKKNLHIHERPKYLASP